MPIQLKLGSISKLGHMTSILFRIFHEKNLDSPMHYSEWVHPEKVIPIQTDFTSKCEAYTIYRDGRKQDAKVGYAYDVYSNSTKIAYKV